MNPSETPRCPACDSPFADGASECGFCGLRTERVKPVWNGLVWLAKAYRIWSLCVFAYALILLAISGHPSSYFIVFLILFPFGMALLISYRMGGATSRWIVAFLILVDLGVIIAPEHRFLPFLNMFPILPKTQNRIVTWYLLVYGMLQFVVLPPIVFFRSLRTAWRGGTPTLAPAICWLGLGTWGLIVAILTIGLTR